MGLRFSFTHSVQTKLVVKWIDSRKKFEMIKTTLPGLATWCRIGKFMGGKWVTILFPDAELLIGSICRQNIKLFSWTYYQICATIVMERYHCESSVLQTIYTFLSRSTRVLKRAQVLRSSAVNNRHSWRDLFHGNQQQVFNNNIFWPTWSYLKIIYDNFAHGEIRTGVS